MLVYQYRYIDARKPETSLISFWSFDICSPAFMFSISASDNNVKCFANPMCRSCAMHSQAQANADKPGHVPQNVLYRQAEGGGGDV